MGRVTTILTGHRSRVFYALSAFAGGVVAGLVIWDATPIAAVGIGVFSAGVGLAVDQQLKQVDDDEAG